MVHIDHVNFALLEFCCYFFCCEFNNYIKNKKEETGIKLLWGTANCFSNPRYMNGAATNPNFNVVAHAGAQVKLALDATIELNGENYVFWGGREGYIVFAVGLCRFKIADLTFETGAINISSPGTA